MPDPDEKRQQTVVLQNTWEVATQSHLDRSRSEMGIAAALKVATFVPAATPEESRKTEDLKTLQPNWTSACLEF